MGDTDNRELQDVLGNRVYKIPYYQRGYVWSKRQVNDLIDDIMFVDKENVNHYFGNIVLSELDNDDDNRRLSRGTKYDIIDGQQRITTITIVFADLYWYSEKLINEIENTSISDNEKQIISELEEAKGFCAEAILSSANNEIKSENLMLSTAKKQENIYQDILLNAPDDREYKPERYSEKRIKEAEEIIWDWLEDMYEDLDGNPNKYEKMSERINDIIDKLNTKFNITEYIVEEKSEAGRIFGVVNDRGKDLNIADKVKSTLVYNASILESADDNLIEDIYDAFAYVYEKISSVDGGRKEMNRFMKTHWGIFNSVNKTGKDLNNLHRIIETERSHLSTAKEEQYRVDWIKYYIENLKEIADSYENIKTYNTGSDFQTKINRRHYYFNNIARRDFLALRLSCDLCLTESEQLKVLNNIEALSLRIHEITKRGSTIYVEDSIRRSYQLHCVYNNETNSRKSSRDIYHTTKGIYTKSPPIGGVIREIITDLQEKYTKNVVKNDCRDLLNHEDILTGNKKVNWTGIPTNVVKYILFRLSEEKGSEPWENNSEWSLEHIRPESRKEDNNENKVNDIGNLCIIEKNLNKKCSDDIYRNKTKIYNNSNYSMPKNIVSNTKKKWNDDNIKSRKEDIIDGFFNLH